MSRTSRIVENEPAAGLRAAPEGILYSSAGEVFVAEALRSARSSLRHNPLPHLLFASADAESQEGLSIVRFEPSDNPYLDKIANMSRSPFERTIFLDSDTFVIDEIVHMLGLLDRYDIAVAHDPSDRGLPDPEVPRAFCEFNTGVVAWRTSDRMAAFMRSWEETYAAWLQDEPFPRAGLARRRADQPAFRRCAWQHDIRLFVLPPEYNFRLGEPGAAVGRVRVLHGHHSDPDAVAARINDTQGPRIWPRRASLPARVQRRLRRWKVRRDRA
jgi:hypothetical protein